MARNREDASSMVTAGAKLTPRRGTVALLGNQGCCVHIHAGILSRTLRVDLDVDVSARRDGGAAA